MNFLEEAQFPNLIVSAVVTTTAYFIKKYILSFFDKRDINSFLTDVRTAYKDQLEALKISKELGEHDEYLDKSISLYRNAVKLQQQIIQDVPSGNGQKVLLNLDPCTTANNIFSNNDKDEKPLSVPNFTKPLEILIFGVTFLVSTILAIFSIFMIGVSIFAMFIGGNIITTIIMFISGLLYLTSTVMLFTGFDSISFKVSGSVLADIFYRKIAHKNGKTVEEPSKIIRANRIRAAVTDETIKDYVYIPKMKTNFLWMGEFMPALPIFKGAILRATNYGYIKGLEDDYKKDPDALELHKISKRIVNFLNLQDSKTEKD